MTAPALLDRVRARLALEAGPPTRAGVAAVVREEAGGLLGDDDVLLAVRNAVDELAGAGPLEPLLRTPGVTDVLVNGPEHVWVDRGSGLELTEVAAGVAGRLWAVASAQPAHGATSTAKSSRVVAVRPTCGCRRAKWTA